MHSTEYVATEDNEYGIEGTVKEKDLFQFNFNSDLSGEVLISAYRHPDDVTLPEVKQHIVIPAWMLLEFVGNFVNGEMISMLENMGGKESLAFLTGGAISG